MAVKKAQKNVGQIDELIHISVCVCVRASIIKKIQPHLIKK